MTNDPGLTVAQMADRTGVSAYTLRWWEQMGLIGPVPRSAGGQRRYQESDIAWVGFLMRLKATGMSVAQMREFARLREQGASTVPQRLALLLTHQRSLDQTIAGLQTHRRALGDKIAVYRASASTTEETNR